jgi:hypothetical protein
MIPAPSFLRAYFPSDTTREASVRFEVQRGTEKIAVDIMRGSRGIRNTFSKWSLKEYLPPFYKEFFDATELDHYDRVFGAKGEPTDAEILGILARDIATHYIEIRAKIERRKELQCSQVLETGVVTMQNGDNLDYKRKSESMVDLIGAGGYWSTADTDVESQLKAGGEFIRRYGKNGTPEFDIIMGGSSWLALKKTNYFTVPANFRQVQLIDIRRPVATSFGAAYHGQLIAGPYILNVWTYDEIYEDADGNQVRYWPDNYAVMIPVSGTRFKVAHAGLPTVMKLADGTEFSETIARVAGEYGRYDLVDRNASAHYFFLMSACAAMPVTVDMIYTMKVLSDVEVG